MDLTDNHSPFKIEFVPFLKLKDLYWKRKDLLEKYLLEKFYFSSLILGNLKNKVRAETEYDIWKLHKFCVLVEITVLMSEAQIILAWL